MTLLILRISNAPNFLWDLKACIWFHCIYPCQQGQALLLDNTLPFFLNTIDKAGLTNVVIPKSVTNIGHSAFCNCSSLHLLEIPKSVTNIGASTTRDITLDGANLIFEGNVANAFETTLSAEEPTTDNTVLLPNASGTLATAGDALAFSIVFGG